MIGCVGILAAASLPARAEMSATGAAFTPLESGTRFVLELSEEPSHRIFVVEDPPRLVIDLDHIAFGLDDAVAPTGLVKAWRYGALTPTAGRIVFDLARPALVSRQFYLPSLAGRPGRLVLDLQEAEPQRFANAANAASAVAGEETPAIGGRAEGPVVVLDPGHGGIDPGAITASGVEEKDIALAFAKRIRAELESVPGITVRLTRSDDRFLSLNRRIRIARAYGADLFVSIHADAAPQDYVHGATVYTVNENASDAQAAALAARENLADEISGAIEPDLKEEVSGILADFMRRETKSFSFAFAEELIGSLGDKVRMNSHPHRYARFRVLMAHDIPSVLLELGYLTNERDAESLLDPEWQGKASHAVAAAIETFLLEGPAETAQSRALGDRSATQ
ncbi:N-acetylmuramoyl-L-alanine amidase [Acuticoccus sp. M5D2P5]|uniref:N-acetylmuramoyl-L-alanine amidase n=1 Tax=Acuticoccus kalidii TaxID=2910977 RepID=UPI001F2AB0CD|nr:N-acetylmuramoyl-L-alanine amidase [Acuticoccus kalidii]MCF3934437.1 N-acetylmuramoyl-L-alanine amidase [Acuticoccus kalidii]